MTSALHTFGLFGDSIPVGVFFTIMFESFGLPLPGESALIAASAAAGAGKTSALLVFLAGWAGAVVGDNIAYVLGHRYGRRLIARYGSRVGLTEQRYDQVEAAARRYGVFMVAGARFFVVLRQFNGVVAGSSGMLWPRFLAANVIGAAAWVGLWVVIGDRISRWLSHHPNVMHFVPLLAIVAAVVVIAVLVYRHRGARSDKPK